MTDLQKIERLRAVINAARVGFDNAWNGHLSPAQALAYKEHMENALRDTREINHPYEDH